MAIIIEGSSKCPLCGKILDNTKEYLVVPPLISNTCDNLFVFSDTGVHIECLNKNTLKEKLLYHIQMYSKRQQIFSNKFVCIVVVQVITDPRKIISFGLLASNEKEELSHFNYFVLNKDNIEKWQNKSKFILTAKKFVSDGKWKSLTNFNYLTFLINELGE